MIGNAENVQAGYFVGKECIGCKLCYSVCPQKCIDISKTPAVINRDHCLHCGRCAEICPKQTIKKVGQIDGLPFCWVFTKKLIYSFSQFSLCFSVFILLVVGKK